MTEWKPNIHAYGTKSVIKLSKRDYALVAREVHNTDSELHQIPRINFVRGEVK